MLLELRPQLHRILLGILLLGNALAFAGVDPLARAITAALALALVLDLPRLPAVPKLHRWAAAGFAILIGCQLAPLPAPMRYLLQPGLVHVLPAGWAPLSLAPWSTVQVAATATIAVAIALAAARIGATRSGLPFVLALVASVGALLSVAGLASEGGAPEKVLIVRDNTGGGSPYGPYVNRNHFAVGLELTLPAAAILLGVAGRNLRRLGELRQRAAVLSLGAAAALGIGIAAMLRSGSRGGFIFLLGAAIISSPLWFRRRPGRRWPWAAIFLLILVGASSLAWTRLPQLRERYADLLMVEGIGGNSRWDLWAGTYRLWQRAPILGTGLGSYRHVVGIDKPPTRELVLEQAHNDWLEWLATGGVAGAAVLALGIAGCLCLLWRAHHRQLRFDYRYPAAGAALAVTAAALHEVVGFGLLTPLNLYLAAVWIGTLWGLAERTGDHDEDQTPGQEADP